MSREVKRVPLDFNWPLDKVWPGYCYDTPDCKIPECPDRHGSRLRWSKGAMCAFHKTLWDELMPKLEPPTGVGWQLWETVSEGSPISPVFATADQLAKWMTSANCTVTGPVSSYEVAMRFIEEGWAPSMVGEEGQIMSGVEWAGRGDR